MKRRAFLGGTAAAIVGVTGCIGGGGDDEGYGDWFSDVDGYDGETDRTGQSDVTVRVGADDGLSYAPVAIRVEAGTTVTWEWTGKGGRHNVVERDGAFTSPYHDSEGATYQRTFDEPGVHPYYCEPHRSLGMKGGVRVE